jgi:hypothetical protein
MDLLSKVQIYVLIESRCERLPAFAALTNLILSVQVYLRKLTMRTNNILRSLIGSLAAACVWSAGLSAAQVPAQHLDKPKKGVLEGEINLQTPVKKQTNPYQDRQDAAIGYFTNLSGKLDKLGSGELSPLDKIGEDVLSHMAGTYLFCSIQKGTCPWILDALLETDVINSRINKKVECDSLPRFWKIWVKYDMQKKQDYQVKTGYMRDTISFKKTKLPRYVGCMDTVKQEISDNPQPVSDADYFKNRYAGESSQRKAIMDTLDYLQKIKSSRIDVFAATKPR